MQWELGKAVMNKMRQPDADTPRARLDREAEALADRHRERLAAMTAEAVSGAKRPRRQPWRGWVSAGLAAGLAVLAVGLAWRAEMPRPSKMAVLQPVAPRIPEWVEDDSVPVSLLENMELYVWISRHAATQPEKPPADSARG